MTNAECDMFYKYSDDDGVTWSEKTSLKSAWPSDATWIIPAPAHGIQLTDGTLVIPCYGRNTTTTALNRKTILLYKHPNGNWTFSSFNYVLDFDGNENTIVEHETNKVKVYCRNVAFPRELYPNDIKRFGTPTFVYDFTTGEYEQIESTLELNVACQFSVTKYGDRFLLTAPDTNGNSRKNITVWASNDSDVWIRCFNVYKFNSYGYSVTDYYDDMLVICFENYQSNISFMNLSPVLNQIKDTCDKYIDHVSVQDRMQFIYQAANGMLS